MAKKKNSKSKVAAKKPLDSATQLPKTDQKGSDPDPSQDLEKSDPEVEKSDTDVDKNHSTIAIDAEEAPKSEEIGVQADEKVSKEEVVKPDVLDESTPAKIETHTETKEKDTDTTEEHKEPTLITSPRKSTEIESETSLSNETDQPSTANTSESERPQTPEPSPVDSTQTSPKPKKRLTLQERLALAAKGRAKKNQKGSSSTPPPNTQPSSSTTTPSQTPLTLSPTVSRDEEATKAEPEKQDTPVKKEEPIDLGQELAQLKLKFAQVQSENRNLAEQVSALRSRPTAAAPKTNSNWDKEKAEYLTKLQTKDETIQQLMEEGQVLSVKELKLNESIKKLKALNNNLEENLRDYAEKNDDSLMKLRELEAVLKANNLASVTELLDSFASTNHQLSNVKRDLESEKSHNWESKYKEQEKLYNEELSHKKRALKELNEIKIHSETIKRQKNLELESKTALISELKQETLAAKQESLDEISRLENKVESLRLEIEYASNGENKRTDQHHNGDTLESDTNGKTIDYNEYAKLSSNHQSLQQQYLSSQENWKIIESNLLNKIDNLTASIETTRKSKIKLSGDLKKLSSELDDKTAEYDDTYQKLEVLKSEIDELKINLSLKESELADLQEKTERFKQIYATERTNLTSKISSLNDTIAALKALPDVPEDSEVPEGSLKRFGDSGLHINLEPPGRYPFARGLSATSVPETPLFQNSNWNDIKLGESSQTPLVPNTIFMHPNSSSTSFNDGEESYDGFRPHSNSFQGRERENSFTQSFNQGGSVSGTIPTGVSNSKIHLINKMSSNIRRLEIELNTLKDENSQLALEKESTEQQLLQKLKLVGEVEELKVQIDELQTQLKQKDEHEQTMLELIGEKSEQVEELRADIVDLKDLCRLQVQQMIEIQERKG